MKKLMIIVAVAFATIVTNGAQMKWGSGALKVPGATTALTGAKGAAAFYLIDAAAYSAIESAIAGMNANEASAYIYGAYASQAATSTSTSFSKGINTFTDTSKEYAIGETAYAVLIYTAKDADGNEYYIANYGKWAFEADSSKTQQNMGTKLGGTGDAISWQSVPEPTGAMLLVLGVAALALRRKQR